MTEDEKLWRTLQDWTVTDDMAEVYIAGVNNDGVVS